MICDLGDSQCTWIESEKTSGASKVLPRESRVLLEVTDEDVIQSLRHVRTIKNVWIYTPRDAEGDEAKPVHFTSIIGIISPVSYLCCTHWLGLGCHSLVY